MEGNDLGRTVEVPVDEICVGGVKYTCMATKCGVESGPDALRVAVAVHRIGVRTQPFEAGPTEG